MAKNVRISEDLYKLARWEAGLQDRSISQQIEYWVKRGLSSKSGAEEKASLDEMLALTRSLDAADVLSGRRPADYLYFIPRSLAKRCHVVFPRSYQKS